MNRVLNLSLCVGLALAGPLGCSKLMDQLNQKKKAEAMLASASAMASAMAVPTVITPATATVASPTSPSVSDEQIPAPEDFEQVAARDITDSNAQAELDKLKKDIGP